MFLRFEENPNSGFTDDRVWKHEGEPRAVTAILRIRNGNNTWCPITGLNEKGLPVLALGIKVEDSGEGSCWLVYGGLWGVRLKDPENANAWSLDDSTQWGEAFLLLPPDGEDLQFALT
jgi:hypothetical protein